MKTEDITIDAENGGARLNLKFPLAPVGGYVNDASGRLVLEVVLPRVIDATDEADIERAFLLRRDVADWVAETLNAEACHLGII